VGDTAFAGTGGGTVAVSAIAVRRHFGDGAARVVPVDGVDLELRTHELAMLTGPSGSGKSTLLHLLTGFDTCDEGTVRWAGVAPGSPPPWAIVGIVPQSLGLLPELTVAANITMPLLLAGVPAAEAAARTAAMMAELQIDHLHRRLPIETSLGQQQRAAVARAVVLHPLVLLADEPTSHQDHVQGDLVMAVIRACVDDGSACLIAGHDPRLDSIADRRLELVDGRLSEVDLARPHR
jgi:putative ABC transport system ATP-binding protein